MWLASSESSKFNWHLPLQFLSILTCQYLHCTFHHTESVKYEKMAIFELPFKFELFGWRMSHENGVSLLPRLLLAQTVELVNETLINTIESKFNSSDPNFLKTNRCSDQSKYSYFEKNEIAKSIQISLI